MNSQTIAAALATIIGVAVAAYAVSYVSGCRRGVGRN
jgi:hypothetical protein